MHARSAAPLPTCRWGRCTTPSAATPHAPPCCCCTQTPRSWAEYRDVLPLLGRATARSRWTRWASATSAPPPWPAEHRALGGAWRSSCWTALGIERARCRGASHRRRDRRGARGRALRARSGGWCSRPRRTPNEAFRRRARPPAAHRRSGAQRVTDRHLAAMWQRRQGFYPAERPDLLAGLRARCAQVAGPTSRAATAPWRSYRMEDRIARVAQPVLDPARHRRTLRLAARGRTGRAPAAMRASSTSKAAWCRCPTSCPRPSHGAVLDFLEGAAMKASARPRIRNAPPRAGGRCRSAAARRAARWCAWKPPRCGHIDRTVWGGKFLKASAVALHAGRGGCGRGGRERRRHAVGQRVWLRGSGLGTLFDGTWCELIDAPDEALGLLPDAVPMTLGSAFFSPTHLGLGGAARGRPGARR